MYICYAVREGALHIGYTIQFYTVDTIWLTFGSTVLLQYEHLKLPDLYRLQLYKLYYKIKKQTVPAYFRHILTEVVNPYNTRNTFFKYPIARHEYTRKTCLYQVINYVNYPPSNPLMKLRTDMSDTHSITGFALYHKNRTLESYSLHCRSIDCYVCRVCQ